MSKTCIDCHWFEDRLSVPGYGADLGGDPSPPEPGQMICWLPPHDPGVESPLPTGCRCWAPTLEEEE